MCGACGHPVVNDPVFPQGRTLRDTLVAAQLLSQLISAHAGSIRVLGLAGGFAVSTPGRQQVLCATVAEVWTTVAAVAPSALSLSARSTEAPGAESPDSRLLQRVLAARWH